MDEQNIQTVPYVVYESVSARADESNKRLWKTIIGLIIALILSNTIWLFAWMQYDYTDEQTISAEQDGSGINVIGGGDVSYGAESNNNEKTEQNP